MYMLYMLRCKWPRYDKILQGLCPVQLVRNKEKYITHESNINRSRVDEFINNKLNVCVSMLCCALVVLFYVVFLVCCQCIVLNNTRVGTIPMVYGNVCSSILTFFILVFGHVFIHMYLFS